jgi:GNAT superfamily N-acetyltransferase
MAPVLSRSDPDLDSATLRGICQLIQDTWPKPEFSLDEAVAKMEAHVARCRADPQGNRWRRHWIVAGDRVAAHAVVFPRTVQTGPGPLEVGALAAVCVAPASRGTGLGRAVVEAALADWLGRGGPVVLFQTAVPDFYRKLGGRLVDNTFVNSRHPEGSKASPWWDRYVMIHPATFAWPAGPVDLLGPGW